jgi:hypothetical protein
MERFLLDTDAVIDHLKGFEPTVSLLQQLHEDDEDDTCVGDARGGVSGGVHWGQSTGTPGRIWEARL